MMNSNQPDSLTLIRLDQELVSVLDRQLDVVTTIVARLWEGALSEFGAAFLDYDNVPIPFCPMYPNARDLLDNSLIALPQPLTKIVQRLRDEIDQTEAMQESLQHLTTFTPSFLQDIRTMKQDSMKEAAYRQGETIGEWQARIHCLIDDARSAVPASFLQLNRLIHVTVLCTVSLAIWYNNITVDDVLSCSPSGTDDTSCLLLDDPEQPIASDEAWPYGPEIPNGYELRVNTTDLIILPFDACVRLQDSGKLKSLAIVIGASMSWSRGEDLDARLTIAEFSSYEFSRVEKNL